MSNTSWLAQVRTAPAKPAPLRIVLYGVEGVGKTTFAASAPRPVFIGQEDGYGNLDVPRFPAPRSLADLRDQIEELATGRHDFATVVLDTIDWMEALIWDFVCQKNDAPTIEDVGGGFGKGYTQALGLWADLMADLDRLRARGLTVIALAHAHSKTTKNPEGADFDRYTLKINDKAAARWKEWCDLLLFARFEDRVVSKDKGDKLLLQGRGKATGGARKLCTTRTPAYDAKNRFSLPAVLPLSFGDLEKVLPRTAALEVVALRARIDELLPLVDLDEEKLAATQKVLATRGTELKLLREMVGKLEGMPLRGAASKGETASPQQAATESSPPAASDSVPPRPSGSGGSGRNPLAKLENALGDEKVAEIRAELQIPANGPIPGPLASAYESALLRAVEAA